MNIRFFHLLTLPILAGPLATTAESRVGSGTWQQLEADGPGSIRLVKPGPVPKKPVRRPADFRLVPGDPVGAFQLDLEAKTLAPDTHGADVVLVFGYQDPLRFYYAHISNDADGRVHTVIMKVEGEKGVRTTIHREKKPGPALRQGWQKLRLVRNAEGQTRVYVDDMDTPHLTTHDATWIKGRVGYGSFNDPAAFRNIGIEAGQTSAFPIDPAPSP